MQNFGTKPKVYRSIPLIGARGSKARKLFDWLQLVALFREV